MSKDNKKETNSTQSSLLSFFGKPAANGGASSSSNANSTTTNTKSKPTNTQSAASKTHISTSATQRTPKSASTSNPKPAVKSAATSGSTTTSEPESALDRDPASTEPSSTLTSSLTKAVPAKRRIAVDSDDDEEDSVATFKKKFTGKTRKAIVDSEDDGDSDSVVVAQDPKAKVKALAAKAKAKAKARSKDDDEDFEAQSNASSEDYFKDMGDDAFFDDEEDDLGIGSSTSKAKKSSPTVARKTASSSPAVSRPMVKSISSGSGGIGGIKTQATLAKEASRAILRAKAEKKATENAFSFLLDPKDMDGVRPGEPGYDPRTLYIPKSAWKQFSPFETQFWEIKQKHYDTVLFFQKGKFFELYEEDAAIGHREFDLKLTDRVKMKMVGVPESSFDFWAAKFLAQGYKVGRVDQCETALGAEIRQKDGKAKGEAKKGKDIVRRELKSVLTTGTIVDGALLTDDLANHCVSIKEFTPDAASAPTFGVCVLDAATAQFQLSSFTDDACRTQVETLIRQLKPKELIHEKGNLSVSTLRLLRNSLGIDCQWTMLKPGTEFLREDDTKAELRKMFGATQADDDDVMDQDANVPEQIREMYDEPVVMSALGGMIWYLRQLNLDQDLVTTKNFNIYDPISQGKALVLDGQTLAHIEVLQNSLGGHEGTLLQLLMRCVTPFGKRLFKIWLCTPLREVAAINDRLDAVDDILANQHFAATFDSTVKKLPDLERMLSRIHAKQCKKIEFLNVVNAFRQIASGLDSLLKAASDFKSDGIPSLLRSAPDFEGLLDDIEALYDGAEILPVDGKDEDYERVKGNVIKYEDALEEELEDARRQLKSKSIQFRDIGTKDIFQLEVPVNVKAPSNWTRMSATKAVNRYYSPKVESLVKKLKEARERKQLVVSDFQYKVYGEFDKDYSTWMQVVKLVAELDCLMSLAKSSQALGEPCVRPQIVESDNAFVEFEELRHPCIFSATTDFIPNDVVLGDQGQRMALLTGPNMAGKSTLLRMTCAATIMAQLGCYVPAVKARIAPIDAIYSRMGANDFIFANSSTFKVEMDDCNKILTKATPRSLVILDELGRGTSTYDGMAIAYSVLHRLATHVGCIGFFATHFTSLTDDFAYHPQIRLCNMLTQVDDETHAVVFLYKLVDGVSPKSYGPKIASLAGMSDELVQRATDISREFETTSRARERKVRANEQLPLTSQADAAFLLKLAQLKLQSGGIGEDMSALLKAVDVNDKRQLLRSFRIIRDSVERSKSPQSGSVIAAA
ncbi:DNA mismatch repair protein msh6 [Microbotryomycetes sp. JL221]|nr:DNA mismatch repair protein msh6 [Microbotryomycetes sp. JL221]